MTSLEARFGTRARLHGINRAQLSSVTVGEEWLLGLDVEDLTCRRCGLGMEAAVRVRVD